MTERIVLHDGEEFRIECDGVNHYTIFKDGREEEILSPCLDPGAYQTKIEGTIFGQALTGRHGT